MREGAILFTAFEPSGDALAAAVIASLRRLEPQRPIYAFGGPHMQQAGAQLIESTTDHAVMLAGALSQAWSHRQRLNRLRSWLAEHPLAAVVAVDSPAANWSICKCVRAAHSEAAVIHLVAPQLWAWAPWRIGKLRRLTDRVLCVLPFEPDWFTQRRVPATFVGHPLFDPAADLLNRSPHTDDLPDGAPRLALLPGSRAGEIRANFPTMLQVARQLRHAMPHMQAIIAASSDANARLIESLMPTLMRRLPVVTERVDDVLHWCDAALVVSGTATLHVAAHHKPMVAMYNTSQWAWWAARWMIRTRTFTLPNLIAESLDLEHIVPEFVPHFGQTPPLVQALQPLLQDDEARRRQHHALKKITAAFDAARFSEAAGREILAMAAANRDKSAI